MKLLYKMLIILSCLIGNKLFAQVGMTTNNPDKSAALDLTSTNKGLLIPRVILTNTGIADPVISPAVSLLVFNTNASIAGPGANGTGYYYWEGSSWKKLITGVPSTVMGLKVISTDYTVLPDDYTIIASKLNGNITISLPDAVSSKGRMLVVNQSDFATDSGDDASVTFNVPVVYSDNVTSQNIISPYFTGTNIKITLQSDGTNWQVISAM